MGDDEVSFEAIARAMSPGDFDVRVLDQDAIWVDEAARSRRLETMGADYQLNVLMFLREHAIRWHGDHLLADCSEARLAAAVEHSKLPRAERQKAAVAWMEQTVLYRRLLSLARTASRDASQPANLGVGFGMEGPVGRDEPGCRYEPVQDMWIAFDSPESLALRPVRVADSWAADYVVSVGAAWRFDIVQLGGRDWAVLPRLVVPWHPDWSWQAGGTLLASSLQEAVVRIRHLLAGPGLSLHEVARRARADLQAVSQPLVEGISHPQLAYRQEQVARLELVRVIEMLSSGQTRDVAITLAVGDFAGTPTQLLEAATAITA